MLNKLNSERIMNSRDYYRKLNNDSLIPEMEGEQCFTPDQMIWFAEMYYNAQKEANGAEQSSCNCNIPLVTNRTCSNCHHCVVNPSSENEHDQYKCFAREHITTISNINNHVCDKWTENSF